MRRAPVWVAISLAAASVPPARPASAEALKPAPFVGCASDGQMGPRPAPRRPPGATTPLVPAAYAGRLAYYADNIGGVLAPRGWRCFGTYGSNGSNLYVTPEQHGARDLLWGRPKRGLPGPGVEVNRLDGGTSGRFAVADIAAGLFPSAKAFVDQVAAEGGPITPQRPSLADRITSRSATRVEFVTAGGKAGLGTGGFMTPSREPIRGAYLLLAEDDTGVTVVRVRLSPDDAGLAGLIVRQLVRRLGASRADQP